MKRRTLLMLAVLALAGLPGLTRAQVEEGKARTVPWSGFWWPHKEGRMLGVLTKYDQWTGKTQASAWERKRFPPERVAKWEGYCHAWSAASLLEREPTIGRQYTGPSGQQVLLLVGDLKGLLTVAHYSDVANLIGRRYNGPGIGPGLPPDVLWRTLKMYIKQKGVPLVLDTDASAEVWNYPVYAYRVEYTRQQGNTYFCRLALWVADDGVEPWFVGTKSVKRTYQFTCQMRGGSVVAGSAKWVGSSVRDHPDFAWYPYVVRPLNPHVKYDVVRRMVGLGPREIAEEPPMPPPVEQPDNPPQPPGATTPRPQPLPGMPPNTPVNPIGLSPTELLALVTHKDRKPAFHFDVTVDRFDGGTYVVGENYFIRGTTAKSGYLYLFHIDNQGNMGLLFPQNGQDNRVEATKEGKLFEIGGSKSSFKFACAGPIGTQRVKAIITTQPLVLGPLNQGEQPPPQETLPAPPQPPQPQRALPFLLNPTLANEMRRTIAVVMVGSNEKDYDGPKKPQEVEQYTGTRLQKLLPEFAHDEVAFYVGPVREKPLPPPDKPQPARPASRKQP